MKVKAFIGPATWPTRYPSAGGNQQSPVDITTSTVQSDTTAPPLTLQYSSDKVLRVVNPGYGWKVEVDGAGSELNGGPLEGNYKLEQFHCHWGPTSSTGSEHTVDGQSYAGELHLVHWNYTKYKTFGEAAAAPDGLAVLGVFLKSGDQPHEELSKVASQLSKVMYRGDTAPFDGELDPLNLLPAGRTYWTYQGSLTTPPCTESVTWIVFKEPIQVTEDQLNTFRSLKSFERGSVQSDESGEIVINFRPPCPLGNRVLRECGCA